MPKPKRRTPLLPKQTVEPKRTNKGTAAQSLRKKHKTNSSLGSAVGQSVTPGGGKRKRNYTDAAAGDLGNNPKRQKLSPTNGGKPHQSFKQGAKQSQHQSAGSPPLWRCISTVHQQATFAVQRLLEADSSRKHGASLKSLTLAPHVVAKKATYAVTCQVLKFSRILQQLEEQAAVCADSPKLNKYTAYVLIYELLRGQGLEKKGPAERAVLAKQGALRDALSAALVEAGVQSLDELLEWQQRAGAQGGQGGSGVVGGAGPEVAHPRWVRVNLLKGQVDQVRRQLQEHLDARVGGAAAVAKTSGKGSESTGAKTAKGVKAKAGGKDGAGVRAGAAEDQEEGQQQAVRPDPHLSDLLALPPGTDLHDHPLVEQGVVVLQSKASCMPAHALRPQPGWTVVDCCAAPGNKTTHVAALMGNKGKVIAYDKDPRRLARLRANASRTGATCVEARLGDFLATDPRDGALAGVRGVLLDPSCSGSGTTFTRMDHLLPSHVSRAASARARAAEARAMSGGQQGGQEQREGGSMQQGVTTTGDGEAGPEGAGGGSGKDKRERKGGPGPAAAEEGAGQDGAGGGQGGGGGGACAYPDLSDPEVLAGLDPGLDDEERARVGQLARFQAAALSHALRFPHLERLVYSTCSVHVAENEAVVAGAMAQAREAGMELVDPFPTWHRRGLPLFDGAEKLVRTDAYEDGTDGFFVAVFQRIRPGEVAGADTDCRAIGEGDEAAAAGGQEEGEAGSVRRGKGGVEGAGGNARAAGGQPKQRAGKKKGAKA